MKEKVVENEARERIGCQTTQDLEAHVEDIIFPSNKKTSHPRVSSNLDFATKPYARTVKTNISLISKALVQYCAYILIGIYIYI